jgi:hypothetical protein
VVRNLEDIALPLDGAELAFGLRECRAGRNVRDPPPDDILVGDSVRPADEDASEAGLLARLPTPWADRPVDAAQQRAGGLPFTPPRPA